jgi:thiamine-phosphate pyrophosphorylase
MNDARRSSLWRILDANANRAGEGLRVVEDYARFTLDDPRLARLVKELRHDLAAALQQLPADWRRVARDTPGDVGTGISTPAEGKRAAMIDVVAASFQRVKQALRCLEEYGKVISPEAGPSFEGLRYRTYAAEREMAASQRSLDRLARVRLYVLIDGGSSADAFASHVAALIAAGVHALQLRDKRLDDRALLGRARQLRSLTAGTDTLFVMNDRPDLAFLSQADGVHVGQTELSVKDARAVVGPQALIGVSTHSLVQARAAVLDGADYIGVGPTFPSTTKAFAEFPGLDLLRSVAREIRLPAFAIGGVTRENLPQVLETGVTRIAVSAAVNEAPDPAAAVRELLGTLDDLPSAP